jgi:hypothetical protein
MKFIVGPEEHPEGWFFSILMVRTGEVLLYIATAGRRQLHSTIQPDRSVAWLPTFWLGSFFWIAAFWLVFFLFERWC